MSVVVIVAWEGITEKYADQMYEYLTGNLNDAGFSTRRRCGSNDRYIYLFVYLFTNIETR